MGIILQIPAALLADRQKDKRLLPIVGGYFNRSTWVLMAFLPFFFPPEQRVGIVILLATFRLMAANLGVPAWTALQADMIPKTIRGTYYANRTGVEHLCGFGHILGEFPAAVVLSHKLSPDLCDRHYLGDHCHLSFQSNPL